MLGTIGTGVGVSVGGMGVIEGNIVSVGGIAVAEGVMVGVGEIAVIDGIPMSVGWMDGGAFVTTAGVLLLQAASARMVRLEIRGMNNFLNMSSSDY